MFLPILLMRDMGWAGFLIFAIPNIVGAASMGWVLKSRTDSERFVEKHSNAIWLFSAVTIAFHLFWLLWLGHFVRYTLYMPAPAYQISLGIALAFALVLTLGRRRIEHIALLLLVFSIGVLFATIGAPDLNSAQASLLDAAPKSLAPAWMLPVMLFGFLFCPYLDITFHHARQKLNTSKNGRLGFTLGFVGFFSCMIFLTTRYAGVFESALHGSCALSVEPTWLATALWIHILCQWLFTVHVHLDRMRTLPHAKPKQAILLLLALAAGTVGFFAIRLPFYGEFRGGEVVYRLFMSAYGLGFPAYVLYRVITRKKWSALWIAIALASPMFWMGFIEQQAVWLIPGMVVVLLGVIPKISKSLNAR
jgi:hypothetical protein